MTASATSRRLGPLLLHLVTGVAVVGYALRVPCGSDECLGPLFAGASAFVWLATAPLVVAAAQGRDRSVRALSWCLWVLCLPVSWGFALALFVVHPELGGA